MAKKKAKQLKTYRITRSVKDASGTQCFLVSAMSPEDAIEKHLRGEDEFEYEEIEVTSLESPSIDGVEEVDYDDPACGPFDLDAQLRVDE